MTKFEFPPKGKTKLEVYKEDGDMHVAQFFRRDTGELYTTIRCASVSWQTERQAREYAIYRIKQAGWGSRHFRLVMTRESWYEFDKSGRKHNVQLRKQRRLNGQS